MSARDDYPESAIVADDHWEADSTPPLVLEIRRQLDEIDRLRARIKAVSEIPYAPGCECDPRGEYDQSVKYGPYPWQHGDQ